MAQAEQRRRLVEQTQRLRRLAPVRQVPLGQFRGSGHSVVGNLHLVVLLEVVAIHAQDGDDLARGRRPYKNRLEIATQDRVASNRPVIDLGRNARDALDLVGVQGRLEEPAIVAIREQIVDEEQDVVGRRTSPASVWRERKSFLLSSFA